MSRKLTLVAAFALIATGCARPEIEVRPGDSGEFVVQVVEFQQNVGPGIDLDTDADGNPHLSYLTMEDPDDPARPAPGAPVLPAVSHAHQMGGLWTHSPVADETSLEEADETAIAVDEQGTHHVVWTEGDRLLYANNAEGAFQEDTETVARNATAPSIAMDGEAPLVAFVVLDDDPEGPGGLVRVATRTNGSWQAETAAEAAPGEPAATSIAIDGGQRLVAYGSEGRALLARQVGDIWESEVADGQGGLGVSMALDAEGNPHLAHYAQDGTVRHAHTIAGAPWETSEVGTGEPAAPASIVVAEDGTHHVAWTDAAGIAYADNATGSFETMDVPAAAGGTRPRLGLGGPEIVHLAWYDTQETAVRLATRGGEEPLLALPTGAPEVPDEPDEPTGPPPCLPNGTDLEIAAPPGAVVDGFDRDCLAAPTGEAFTIAFANDDAAPHNVSIYRDSTAAEAFFTGDIADGGESIAYEVDAIEEEGQFFFHCDLHPTTMTGVFVVQ